MPLFSHIAQKGKRLFVQEVEKHAIDKKGKISKEKCGKMKAKDGRGFFSVFGVSKSEEKASFKYQKTGKEEER